MGKVVSHLIEFEVANMRVKPVNDNLEIHPRLLRHA